MNEEIFLPLPKQYETRGDEVAKWQTRFCVVEKTDCISTNDDNGDDRSLTPMELELGNYDSNRFYYPTKNCRRLKEPVSVSGFQGIFFLPPDVEKAVMAQI